MDYSRMAEQPEMDEEKDIDQEPDLTVAFDVLPEAQSWKDGETYEITVQQISHDDKSATFEIMDAGSEEQEDNTNEKE